MYTTIYGHRVMEWEDEPWGEAALDEYVRGSFCDLHIRVSAPRSYRDLEFLHTVPGLRSLTVEGVVKDDTAAFRVDGWTGGRS